MTTKDNQEQEVKFYLANLPAFEKRLQQIGAQLVQPRTFEANLRFDTPDRSLTRARQVLRLRQDESVRLTFKGPQQFGSDVSVREEIEFEVSSFENARAFLEALGYQVSIRYDKYRTTYRLGDVEVVLDELPYADFAEIESPNTAGIQAAAAALGLKWDARSLDSYIGLFSSLRQGQALDAQNLTFEEVKQRVPAEAMGLRAADI